MGCRMARYLQSTAVNTPAFAPLPDVASTGSPDPSGTGVTSAVSHPRAVRSFVMRAGRTTTGQARAMEELGPEFLVAYQASLEPLARLYLQLAAAVEADGATPATPVANGFQPLVLEIGFGMGEATAHIAALMPDTQFLCCEVHPPGVGALLKRIGEAGLRNIRIVAHDAVEVIDHMLPAWQPQEPARGLDGVYLFFPDPWHKKRHNKRRLIQDALVTRLASRLKPGGYIHCATDWQPYAEQMLQVLGAQPLLHNRNVISHPELKGYAPKPHYRPLTKFEKRGIGLGHGVWDLVFHRV
jgi:tRNA (guanine-N7-)-methyltransferase